MITVTELQSIGANGGGIILDLAKSNVSVQNLSSIAYSCASGGATFTIKGVLNSTLTAYDLTSIAASGGGRVIFDLS